MFHLVLFQPQIAPNTGNIIRLVANNGCYLHIIEPMGFDFEEKKLRRAGLDYHDLARVTRYQSYELFLDAISLNPEMSEESSIYAITTKGQRVYADVSFKKGDILVFGSETSGLPPEVMNRFTETTKLRIPMQSDSRSLNLANAVAIVSYEAWRQNGFGSSV